MINFQHQEAIHYTNSIKEDKNMTGAMMKMAAKLGPRIPKLLGRAALGDPTAIATLALMGIVAVGAGIKSAIQER